MAIREATIRLNVDQQPLKLKKPDYKKYKLETVKAHKEIAKSISAGELQIRKEYEKTANSILRLIKLDRQRTAESQRNAQRRSAFESGSSLRRIGGPIAAGPVQRGGPIASGRNFTAGRTAGRAASRGAGGRLAGTALASFGGGALADAASFLPGLGQLAGNVAAAAGGGAVLGGGSLLAATAALPLAFYGAQYYAKEQTGKSLDGRLAEVHKRRNRRAQAAILRNRQAIREREYVGQSVQNSVYGLDPLKAGQILRGRSGDLRRSLLSTPELNRRNGDSRSASASGLQNELSKNRELLKVDQQRRDLAIQSEKALQGRLSKLRQEVVVAGRIAETADKRLRSVRFRQGSNNIFEASRKADILRRLADGKSVNKEDELSVLGDVSSDVADDIRKGIESSPEQKALQEAEAYFREKRGLTGEGSEADDAAKANADLETKARRNAAASGLHGDAVDEAAGLATSGDVDAALAKSDAANAQHQREFQQTIRDMDKGLRATLQRITNHDQQLKAINESLARVADALKERK